MTVLHMPCETFVEALCDVGASKSRRPIVVAAMHRLAHAVGLTGKSSLIPHDAGAMGRNGLISHHARALLSSSRRTSLRPRSLGILMNSDTPDSTNRWISFRVKNTQAQQAVLAIRLKWTQIPAPPASAAVFARLDLRDGSINFHLSPCAAYALPSLASEYGGVECDPPLRVRGIWVLAGASHSIDRLSRELGTLP